MELVKEVLKKEIERIEILLKVENNVLIKNDMNNEITELKNALVILFGVGSSKPETQEQLIDYEECVWYDPAYEQDLINIDKSLDLDQSTEDKTLS